MSDRRPESGVRYVLARARVEPDRLVYEGFAHLPDADVPLVVEVAIPAGTVHATSKSTEGVTEERAADLARNVAPLVRAATKAEIASGEAPPRKIVRWRA